MGGGVFVEKRNLDGGGWGLCRGEEFGWRLKFGWEINKVCK